MELKQVDKQEQVMKRVELKRIAEFFRRGNSNEEKTPFAQGMVAEHGSISKSFSEAQTQNEIPKKELSDEKSAEDEGPMSIPRKFCFVMSFNVWIFYFVALGWLIPCRNLNCDFPLDDVWETNLTNVWPLTNVETFNVKGLPSLAMLGYAAGKDLNLGALATSNGIMEWNNTLKFIPRRVQCNFEINFDVNRDGIADCLLTGYNDVYAFNASNGHVFWEQNLPSDVGNIVSRFHPTTMHNDDSFLIGTCGDKLIVLSVRNGTKYSEADLPCSAPFDIRLVANVNESNFTLWNIVCDYGDKVEAWVFAEEDVLKRGNSNTADETEFALLFSKSNSGSIDLGCDVTLIPGGPLLLSWSEQVVMVTSKGSTWEKTFPNSVASIKAGHFTDPKEMQVAVAVHNYTNTAIYILEANNGTVVNSVVLEDRQPQSLEKIIGDNIDIIVVKSLSVNFSSVPMYNFSDPVPRERTNFALVEFQNNKFVVKDIVTTATVVGFSVNVKTDGEADLLVIKIDGGDATFQKYIIYKSRVEGGTCRKKNKPTTHIPSEM